MSIRTDGSEFEMDARRWMMADKHDEWRVVYDKLQEERDNALQKAGELEDAWGEARARLACTERVLREAGFGEEPKSEGEYMNMIECGLPPKAVRMVGDLRAKIEHLKKRVAAWEAAVFTKIEQCATCDGEGFMEVLVAVLPPDCREVTEPEPCAECGGTGRGEIKAVMDILRADIAAAHKGQGERDG